MSRVSYLTAAQFTQLNDACVPVAAAFGEPPYLVGSVTEGPDYRDIDLRVILDDDEFDRQYVGRGLLWSLVCFAITTHLTRLTGLPIDFQIQRMTEANAKYPDGARHPMGLTDRPYAGGGDATRFGGVA